jgi:GT2 family glycosyltransferase
MLEQIGLFDEDYFAYNEEFDVALRAQLAGWKCAYVPEAVIFHLGGATRAKQDERFRIFQMERNRLCTIVKDYPVKALLYYFPFLAKYELDALLRLIRSGDTAFLQARIGFLRLLGRMLKKRQAVQRTRVISFSRFKALFTPPDKIKGNGHAYRV